MLARLSAGLIIGFWLVMTALLIRLEIHPDQSRVLDVPVSHVLRLIFDHDQQSLLSVKENDLPVGVVSLRPSTASDGSHSLDCTGNLTLHLPMTDRQRLSWNATVDMDRKLATREFKLDLAIREPAYRIAISGKTEERAIHYEVQESGKVLSSGTFSLDGSDTAAMLQQMGISADLLRNAQANFASPTVVAKQTELLIKGETIEVYQITVRQGGTAVADLYITQLGQVLMVNTPFGYHLATEGL
jgi:hypothetical protein